MPKKGMGRLVWALGDLLQGIREGQRQEEVLWLKQLILLVFVLIRLFLPFPQVFNGILRLG